jgi:hypothetical protein
LQPDPKSWGPKSLEWRSFASSWPCPKDAPITSRRDGAEPQLMLLFVRKMLCHGPLQKVLWWFNRLQAGKCPMSRWFMMIYLIKLVMFHSYVKWPKGKTSWRSPQNWMNVQSVQKEHPTNLSVCKVFKCDLYPSCHIDYLVIACISIFVGDIFKGVYFPLMISYYFCCFWSSPLVSLLSRDPHPQKKYVALVSSSPSSWKWSKTQRQNHLSPSKKHWENPWLWFNHYTSLSLMLESMVNPW